MQKTHCNHAVSLEKAIQIAPFSTDCAVAFGHVVDGQSRNLNFALSRWFVLHAVRCWVVKIFQLQSENHGVSLVLTCITIYESSMPIHCRWSLYVCLTVPSWIGTQEPDGTIWTQFLHLIFVVGEMVALKDVSLMSHCCSFHQLPSFWWTQVAIQVAILSFRCRFSQDATVFALAFRSVLMETPAGPRRLN